MDMYEEVKDMGEKLYEIRRVEKEDKGMPLIGDEFPEMEVTTTHALTRRSLHHLIYTI